MSFQQFKTFAQQATTRCGIPFELKTVQKNADGEVTAVKGCIILKNEKGEEVQQEMLWNLKGQAMLLGEQFDLVQEQAIDDQEEDTAAVA